MFFSLCCRKNLGFRAVRWPLFFKRANLSRNYFFRAQIVTHYFGEIFPVDMAGRKLARDLFLSKQPVFRRLLSSQLETNVKIRLIRPNVYTTSRQLSVLNEFSKQVKGEASSHKEFQQSFKELKEKTEELKGVKEDLKARTKQTAKQLYKQVGVWTEAEATAKKVSSNIFEKFSVAKEEVKDSFGIGKEQESSSTSGISFGSGTDEKPDSNKTSAEGNQDSVPTDTAGALFGMFKFGVSDASAKVSMAFQKVKDAKVLDFAKMGYEIVKEELTGKPKRRKPMNHTCPSTGETSPRTEIAVVPRKQSRWSQMWEEFKDKTRGHPMFKRVTKISEPVVEKSKEFTEDLRERWETSDNPMVHKIQDLNDKVFDENDAALSFKEIRSRDPAFSLPDFVAEVQEIIRPVLNAYMKVDAKILQKYCSPEVIERRVAEHKAYENQGIFFDNTILHISDVEVRETKMMGTTPIMILAFQTQQVHCVRDRQGSITEGSKDTIHTVHYVWAMQQVEPEDAGEDAVYAMWRLREMLQMGVPTLI